MSKNPTSQPVEEKETAQTTTQATPVSPTRSIVPGMMLGVLMTFVLLILGIIGYLVGSGRISFQKPLVSINLSPTGNQIACTMEAKICPDGSSVGRRGPSCEFDPCPTGGAILTTPKAIPTLTPNPSGKTFYSSDKGIGFYYADAMYYDKKEKILVREDAQKIYIFPQSIANPTGGQYVEIFTKSPADTLSQAISKKFLAGIPTTTCFVKKQESKDPAIEMATIAYPVPEDATEPNFVYGEKCPQPYSESNGMAYFWYNPAFPDRYYYFSIGQYAIQAHDDKDSPLWQDTFEVFK